MKTYTLPILLLASFLLSGCYTQLAGTYGSFSAEEAYVDGYNDALYDQNLSFRDYDRYMESQNNIAFYNFNSSMGWGMRPIWAWHPHHFMTYWNHGWLNSGNMSMIDLMYFNRFQTWGNPFFAMGFTGGYLYYQDWLWMQQTGMPLNFAMGWFPPIGFGMNFWHPNVFPMFGWNGVVGGQTVASNTADNVFRDSRRYSGTYRGNRDQSGYIGRPNRSVKRGETPTFTAPRNGSTQVKPNPNAGRRNSSIRSGRSSGSNSSTGVRSSGRSSGSKGSSSSSSSNRKPRGN